MKKLALACAAALGFSALMTPQAMACDLFFECFDRAQVACAQFHAPESSSFWQCVDSFTASCVEANGGCS